MLDAAAAVDGMPADVRSGLALAQKELPPRFFYDRRGSELFEAITRLPEYYLTRAEIAILEEEVASLVAEMAPRSLLELGAGSGRKTRILLEAMRGRGSGASPPVYVPLDMSAEYVREAAAATASVFDGLRVRPVIANLSKPGFLGAVDDGSPTGEGILDRPTLVAFLGSTIGNFRPAGAGALLSEVAGILGPDDAFLLGVDLAPGDGKSVETLEAAYNDSAGVTAEFNLNVLRVLNRTVGTDFDPDAFRHRAFFDAERSRIEMHLVATSPQVVTLPDGVRVRFREGESVRTEISCKYDRASAAGLLESGGLTLEHWIAGKDGLYAMAVGRPRG